MKSKSLYTIMGLFIIIGTVFSLTVEEASIEELSSESELIVYGRVISTQSIWENQVPGNINTFSEILPLEIVKGNAENTVINKERSTLRRNNTDSLHRQRSIHTYP